METQSHYQIERLETQSQLDSLEKEWSDLIAGIRSAPVYLSWEWIRTWWFYFNHNRELWLLVARDKQGHLLGLAPFMKELRRAGWQKLRIIAFIGTGRDLEVHNSILTHSSNQEELSQVFLDYLYNHASEWDAISFASVAQECGLDHVLTAGGWCVRTGTQKISVYIPLPGSWELYLATLSKKLRRNLRYFRSRLEEDHPGGVDFTCVTSTQELPGALKKLEELSKERWHPKGRISNFDDPNYALFHQAIASLALERGWLRLYQLTVQGHVIAICYNFRFQDRVYACAIGFDLDWSGYSPGRLAIANSIQAAIQEGACEYDWGAGDHSYKFAWTDKVRVEKELLFSHNWRGRIWIEWRNLKEILIVKGRQWLPQSTRDRINRFLAPRYKKVVDQSDKDAK
jgi:CelD/BcsL family acetyltransferase involved in cellulose biosynthesis